MNKRRLEVSIGRTVNLGDFESVRIDVGLSFDILDNSLLDKEYSNAWDAVEEQIGKVADKLENKWTNKTEKIRQSKRHSG